MIRSLDNSVYHYANDTTSWLGDTYNWFGDTYNTMTSSNVSLKFNEKSPKEQILIILNEIETKILESIADIDKVIFNEPATVIIFKDGTKSVVKCSEHDEYDPEKGFAMALLKRICGKKKYKTLFKKYTK